MLTMVRATHPTVLTPALPNARPLNPAAAPE
jgi:hypothetical protein